MGASFPSQSVPPPKSEGRGLSLIPRDAGGTLGCCQPPKACPSTSPSHLHLQALPPFPLLEKGLPNPPKPGLGGEVRSKGCRRPLLSSPEGQEQDGGQEEGFGGALCIYTGGQDTPGCYMVSSCRREQSQEWRGHPQLLLGTGVPAPIPSWNRGGVPAPHSP